MADQKHKDSPKSSKPRLDGLPVEILLRIVQHMDKRDAPSVARVCKSLVDPGESVIWRTVSLALGQSWGNNHRDIWELCGDVIGDTRMALDDSSLRRRERLEYTPIEPSRTWSAHCAKMENRLELVEKALKSRPQRVKHVRKLIVEPTPRVWKRLFRVVGQVWPTLEHLEIDMFGMVKGGQREVQVMCDRLCDQLRQLKPNHHLRIIELKLVGQRSEDIVAQLLRLAPKLEDLSLRQTPADMPPLKTTIPEKWSTITLDSLKRIVWFRQQDQLRPLVDRLLAQAPRLEEFRLQDKLSYGSGRNTVASALRAIPTLRRLVWESEETIGQYGPIPTTGFENIEELVVPYDLGNESHKILECIEIPPFPALRTILVPATNHNDSVGKSSLVEAFTSGQIHPQIAERLAHAPSLEYVQFCGVHQERIDPDISSWCDKEHNAIMIRTYGEGPDQLIHLRRLTFDDCRARNAQASANKQRLLGARNPNRERCSGISMPCDHHTWEDRTDFRGLPVPHPVLVQFYQTLGETHQWTQPARLPVPVDALDILQTWRSGEGQAWYGPGILDLWDFCADVHQDVLDERGEQEHEQEQDLEALVGGDWVYGDESEPLDPMMTIYAALERFDLGWGAGGYEDDDPHCR